MPKEMAAHFDAEAQEHDQLFVQDLGLKPFYDAVESALETCRSKEKILVLGCGSGLEIERIHFPCNVVGVDLSANMLEILKGKTLAKGVQLTTVCASFLEWDFGANEYDIVLSCYAMHHFQHEQKERIYRKVYACLKADGTFLNGDLIAPNVQAERDGMQQALAVYEQQNKPFGSLHVDVPFCWQHEKQVLKQAGFGDVALLQQWTNTKLYRCVK